ncbi:MAG: phosphoribosylaminoimidazolesuccinocarboxamide synthase [Lactobacillales bacterium]|jgi:phosphoribosylaminoimidazole-succinocarboxamide synthase|nr:phosphoribosylaminoimidazolesuccinocarboxamide synthase [Lactobacillales bacterium]
MTVEKQELLYTGKAKNVYLTNDDNLVWVEYMNQATAGNGAKKAEIAGKGELNNQITSKIFEILTKHGVHSHFVRQLSDTEQLIKRVAIIPLEVVVRNVAAGSFTKRLGIEEGTQLRHPIVEFYFKEDALDDPFINDAHVELLEIATPQEIEFLKRSALRVNEELIKMFQEIGIRLIDFKLEYGRTHDGDILLADEISPDTCRLWDINTNEHLDKDVFRRDLGDIVPVYQEVLNRLNDKF